MKVLFLYIVILAVSSPIFAQLVVAQHVNSDGRFTISLASKPTSGGSAEMTLDKYELVGENVIWDSSPGYSEVTYFSVYGPNALLSTSERNKVVALYAKAIEGDLKAKGVDANLASKPFVAGGFRGVELRGSVAKLLLIRIFFTKTRLYVVSLVRPEDMGFGEMTQVADSFRYLTEQEYIEALIKDNLPKHLPQERAKDLLVSDAVLRGLKGRVRSVVEEVRESPGTKRELLRKSDYDEMGSLTREISYTSGFPDDLVQWGWIDNFRVSNSEMISYPLGEGPNRKEIVSIMTAPVNMPAETTPRDQRYSSKYEYKFDDSGRLIETIDLSNNNREFSRESRSYEVGKRTTIRRYVYSESESKLVELLDSNGNVIEEQYFGDDEKLDWVTVFKFDKFDEKGNWVVRRSFEKKKVRSKFTLRLVDTTYRTITYY
ncbi:MAG TPA: hypothetical protein PKA82_08510 [Pyrinomonadaceae bacterium]|nr:hypothetical protein [Pyrinomonadaceae bacterium]